MKKRIGRVIVILVFLSYLGIVAFFDSLKEPLLGGSLILDVPDDFVTEVATIRRYHKDGETISKSDIKDEINDMLSYLPNGVHEMLDDYTIIVTDKDITTLRCIGEPYLLFDKSYKGSGAFVNFVFKVIVLNANQAKYRDHLYHEVGHVVDISLDWVSKQDEWQRLFQEEYYEYKENVGVFIYKKNNTLYRTRVGERSANPKEYFANAFFSYRYDNLDFVMNCPESYFYIQSVLYSL